MLTIYYTQLNIDSVTSGTSWHKLPFHIYTRIPSFNYHTS